MKKQLVGNDIVCLSVR